MTVVVPPTAAAAVPVRKSSLTRTLPTGRGRGVCAAMPPGTTRSPAASTTSSPSNGSSTAPTACTRPPATRRSPGRSPSASTRRPPRISIVPGTGGEATNRGAILDSASTGSASVDIPSNLGHADRMGDTTPGLVCGHHHLYSALARGMPAPPRTPTSFLEILEQIWWRLDVALDLEMLRWSAMLGALEALESGTTAIVDHHESPSAIEGSLDTIAEACGEVGVRVVCCYGVTDRHGPDGARRGLEENERFHRAGGRGMVGVHAAFTCSDPTLEAAAGLGVGVHVHVAEGDVDAAAAGRLAPLVRPDW